MHVPRVPCTYYACTYHDARTITHVPCTWLYVLLQLGLGGDLRGVLLRRRQSSYGPALAEEQVRYLVRYTARCLRHGLRHGLRHYAARDTAAGGACRSTAHCALCRVSQPSHGPALGAEQVRFYAAVLVLVLEHMHAKGFVYRDLKPDNVTQTQTQTQTLAQTLA